MNPEQRNRSKSLPMIGASLAQKQALQQKGLRRRPTPNPSTTGARSKSATLADFAAGVVTPTLSVKESATLIELTAELPGIQAPDVQVEIRRNVLWLVVVKTEEGSDRYTR